MTSTLIATFFVALGACTSSNLGTATVVGNVGSAAFVAADAIAVVDANSAKIVISSTPNACADIRDHIDRANSRVLVIAVFDQDTALTTGNFTTSAGSGDAALFESNVTDAQCAVSYDPPPDGTGDGTVTLTDVTATTVTGTFDVIMENGEHVTGSFAPEECPELDNEASGSDSCSP